MAMVAVSVAIPILIGGSIDFRPRARCAISITSRISGSASRASFTVWAVFAICVFSIAIFIGSLADFL